MFYGPPFEGSRPRVNFVTPVGAINQVAAAREGTQGCPGTLDQTGARLKMHLGGNESLTGDGPASLANWFLGRPCIVQIIPRMGPGIPKAWFSFLGNFQGHENGGRLRVEIPTLRWVLSIPLGNVRELPKQLQQTQDEELALKAFLEYLNNTPERCDENGFSVFIMFVICCYGYDLLL